MIPDWVVSQDSGRQSHAVHAHFYNVVDSIKKTSTWLVGHNMFLDLVYVYETFFGILLDSVKHFASIIHVIFPHIFDTKYLADKLQEFSPRYRSSLQELDRELRHEPNATIGKFKTGRAQSRAISLANHATEIASGFDKYDTIEPLHEAAYDSLVTAQIFLRLVVRTANPDDCFIFSSSSSESSGDEQSAITGGQRQTNVDYLGTPNIEAAFGDFHLGSQPRNEQTRAGTWRALIPHADHDFWVLHGNRVRCNGTVEGRCKFE